MFASLFGKTFSILALQLFITWAATVVVLGYFREMYRQKKLGITATHNEVGELDLHLNFEEIKPFFYGILVLDIIVFIVLLIWGQQDISLGLPLFSAWSVLTGVELALALLAVDENLGSRVLAITASVTAGAAWIGMYSDINLSFLGPILFWGLLLLLVGNMIRIFIAIPRNNQRVMSFFGAILFVGYLLYDFNKLAQAAENENNNTWPNAMHFAIEIYLDIINLFLYILDLMSD